MRLFFKLFSYKFGIPIILNNKVSYLVEMIILQIDCDNDFHHMCKFRRFSVIFVWHEDRPIQNALEICENKFKITDIRYFWKIIALISFKINWFICSQIYLRDRFRIVLRRASADKLDRSSWPLCCPCSKCVWELVPSKLTSALNEPARELFFSIAAISSKQLKNDCFYILHFFLFIFFYDKIYWFSSFFFFWF